MAGRRQRGLLLGLKEKGGGKGLLTPHRQVGDGLGDGEAATGEIDTDWCSRGSPAAGAVRR
jgi:hypothetical protein